MTRTIDVEKYISDEKSQQNNYDFQKDDKVKVIRHIPNSHDNFNNIPIKNQF